MSRPIVKPIIPILFGAAASAFAYGASYANADGPANPEAYDSEVVVESDASVDGGVDGGTPTSVYDAGTSQGNGASVNGSNAGAAERRDEELRARIAEGVEAFAPASHSDAGFVPSMFRPNLGETRRSIDDFTDRVVRADDGIVSPAAIVPVPVVVYGADAGRTSDDGGMPSSDAGTYVVPSVPVIVPPVETAPAIKERIIWQPPPPGRSRRTTPVSQPRVTILTENLPDYIPGQPWAARVLVEAPEGTKYDCALSRKSAERLTGINPTNLRGSDNELIGCGLETAVDDGIKYGRIGEPSTDVTPGHQYDFVLNLMPADKKNRLARPLATHTYHLNVVAAEAPANVEVAPVEVSAVEVGPTASPGNQAANASEVPLESIVDNEGPTFELRIEPVSPTSNDVITVYSTAADKSGVTDHSLGVNATPPGLSVAHYFKHCDTNTTCTEQIGPLIAGTVIDYRSFAMDIQGNVGESVVTTLTIVAAPVNAPIGVEEVPVVADAEAPAGPVAPSAESLPVQGQQDSLAPVADDLSAHVADMTASTSTTSSSAWTFEVGAGARYLSNMPNLMPSVRLHVGRQIVDGLSVIAGVDVRYGQDRTTTYSDRINEPSTTKELLSCEGESSCNTPLFRAQRDESTTSTHLRDNRTQYGGPTVGVQYNAVNVGSDSTLGLFAEGTIDVQKEHVRTADHTNTTRRVSYVRDGVTVRELSLGPEETGSINHPARTVWTGNLETTLGPVLRMGAGDGHVVVRGGVTYDFRNDSLGGMLNVGYEFGGEGKEAPK
ncbi:hypothetical protein J4444_00755 [Candidatus Woesearchaeota archaeon]|nr:hypothetical protein [Candidatus Woesearchaeota archaeon]